MMMLMVVMVMIKSVRLVVDDAHSHSTHWPLPPHPPCLMQGKISRDEIAELCCAVLSAPQALNTTFEIKSTVPFSQPWTLDPSAPPAPRDWAAFLSSAHLKAGVTGKTVGGVYTGKEEEAKFASAL